MKGFKRIDPPEDGEYLALIKWHDGYNTDDDCDYSIRKLTFINGTWYDFDEDACACGFIDFDILGYQELEASE